MSRAEYRWTDHFKSPKAVATTAKRNPQLLAFSGAVGAAGATEKAKDTLPAKQKKKADVGTAAVYGAAGGQAAYQVAGYAGKTANAKVNDPKIYKDPKLRRGYTTPEYKKKVEGVKAAHGIKDPKQKSDWKGFHRNFPKDVPGGKTTRVLARTHGGKTGMAVGAAATGVGAALAARAEHNSQKDKVKKMFDFDYGNHASSPFLVDNELSKAEKKGPSAGRVATGSMFGWAHGLVQGKKGHKLKAAGNQLGGAVGGNVLGSTAATVATRGRNLTAARIGGLSGATVGAGAGTVRAHNKGHFKPEQKR